MKGISGEAARGSLPWEGLSRAAWSGLDAAAAPVAALIMTAGLVRTLGADYYGLLVMVLAVSGLSMAIIPSIAATSTRFIAAKMGQGGGCGGAAARMITASMAAIAAVDLLLLIIAISFRNPLSHLIFGHTVFVAHPESGDLFVLAAIALCVQQADSVLAGAIRGLERFKEQAILEVGTRAILVLTAISVSVLTHNVRAVLMAVCAVCAIAAGVRAIVLRACSPDDRIFAIPERSDFAEITQFGGWMWLNSAVGLAYGATDRIIIGHVLGSAAAGQFNVYLQIAQLIHYVPSSVFAFSFPVLSRLAADASDQRRLMRSYRNYLTAIVCAALAIVTAIILLRQPLLKLFVGNVSYGNQIAFTLLIITFLFHACSVAPIYLLLALGASRLVSVLNTSLMLIAVGLTPVLVLFYGLEGAATARLLHGIGVLAFLERARLRLKRS
jgi:O-antigen/teichoic acid export membrane protein